MSVKQNIRQSNIYQIIYQRHDTGLVISKLHRDTVPADYRKFIFPNFPLDMPQNIPLNWIKNRDCKEQNRASLFGKKLDSRMEVNYV